MEWGGGSKWKFLEKNPSSSFNYYKRKNNPPFYEILIIPPRVHFIWPPSSLQLVTKEYLLQPGLIDYYQIGFGYNCETCGGVLGGNWVLIFTQSYMPPSQGVRNSKKSYFYCFLIVSQVLQALNPSFFIHSSPDSKI